MSVRTVLHAGVHVPTCTCTRAHLHPCVHACTRTTACALVRVRVRARAYVHVRMRVYAHACKHARVRECVGDFDVQRQDLPFWAEFMRESGQEGTYYSTGRAQ